jgi:hypothetical protein
MTRFVPIGLMLVLIFVLTGCGAVFVGFVSNPGVVPLTISGTVTIVQLGFVADGQGTIANVTAVTLVDLGRVRTMTFCGDQRTFFPINQSVKAEFTSGTLCSTLKSVVFFPSSASANRLPSLFSGSNALTIHDSPALQDARYV